MMKMIYITLAFCVLYFQFIIVSPEFDNPTKIPFTFNKPFKFFGSTINHIQVAENKTLYLSGTQTYNNVTINVMSSLTLPWPHLPPLSVTQNVIMINDTDFAEKTKNTTEMLTDVLGRFNKTDFVLLSHVTWTGIFSVDQSKNATVSLEVLFLTEGNSSLFLVKVGDLIKVRTVAGTNTFFMPRQVKLTSSITTLTLFIPSVFDSSNIGPEYKGSWLLKVDARRTTNSVMCSIKVQPHSSIVLYNSSHLYYKCDQGWNTVMNNSREYLKCNKGQWKENMRHDVTCYEIICPKLKLDPAGTVGIDIRKVPKRPIGAAHSSVNYFCSKNYYIDPDKSKNYCFMNGTWSTGSNGPKCHLDTTLECTRSPPTVNHSIVISSPPYYTKTAAQYKCMENYSSNTTNSSVKCLVHGAWDTPGFSCVSNSINNTSDKLFATVTEMLIIGALSAATMISIVTTCCCICGRRKKRRDRKSRVVLTRPILVAEARSGQAKSKAATTGCSICPEHINKFCTQHPGTRISWIPVISTQKKKSISYVNESFEDF